jgi:MATE family multidrug resistance protein
MTHSSVQPATAPRARESAQLLTIAWPLVANNLLSFGMTTVDTLMAARLGPQSLAAVSIGSNLYSPLILFVIGALAVLSATAAHSAGARRHAEIGATLRQGVWLALVIGAGVSVLLVAADAILARIGLEPEVRRLARDYMRALAWGAPAASVYYVLRFTSEGLALTRPIMALAACAFVFNAAANYVLMYGKLGFPALGTVGCGYATALASWLLAAGLASWMHLDRRYASIEPFARFDAPQAAPLNRLFRLGLPAGLSLFFESALFNSIVLIIAWMGTTVVAAHQIAFNYAGIMFMVPLALGLATTVRVGAASGRGDRAGARRAGFLGMRLAVLYMFGSAAVMLAFGREIIGWYSDDREVQEIAAGLLLVAAAFQVFDGLQVAANGALRGLKDTRVPMFINVGAYWGVGFPAAWWLGIGLGLGPQGVWGALVAALLVAATALTWRFARVSAPD